ncbi:MAG: hypothetical protein AAFQ82_12120, partial [Myxococcota bacterium]
MLDAVLIAALLSTPLHDPSDGASVRFESGLVALLSSQLNEAVGWPWEKGEPTVAHNTGGVIATALVRARQEADSPQLWITLIQYAHHLTEYYGDSARTPHMADVTFLASVDDLVPGAAIRARELFSRVLADSSDGATELARLETLRASTPEIVGYDSAFVIRAASMVGETQFAYELADAAVAGGHLELTNPQDSFVVTSVGALSVALQELDAQRFQAPVAKALSALESAQGPNGAWAMNNAQATAYALAALRQSSLAEADTRGAIQLAARWLVRVQQDDGAWLSYHDGPREIGR